MGNTSKRLIILHTNDVHSCFENMPKLASRIGYYRTRYTEDELLVVDCGDHMDRVRLETEGSGGQANVEVMNATGYEVFVPGNNEGLTFPKAALESVLQGKADFTVLGTNMYDLASGQVPAWMAPWHVTVKDGIRIGIIGVTASYNDFYHPLGWDIRDPLNMVKDTVSKLRSEVEYLLVVSHVGILFDRQLASEVSGIDCIIGGHTHHLFEQAERHGQTLIGAAGKLGQHLGVIELEFNAQTRQLISAKGHAESVLDEPDDRVISTIINEFRVSALAVMERTVAVLNESITHDPLRESELGNLLAGGIRKWTNSDVGIVNSGQLLNGLTAGTQTDADMLSICPSPINPCSSMLLGSEIEQALEASLVKEIIHKEIKGYGFRGKVLGVLCLSGMDVIYDPAGQDYHKIKSVRIQNELMQPDRLYKVGTIDMFTFGVGYPSLGGGRETQYYLPEFIRDVLKLELGDEQAIQLCKQQHWNRLK